MNPEDPMSLKNRSERRRYFKKFSRPFQLGSWKEFSSTQITRKPYINVRKQLFRMLLSSGMSYKAARKEMSKSA